MAPNYALTKDIRPETQQNPKKPLVHVQCGNVLDAVGDGKFSCVTCLMVGYAFPAPDHV